MTSRFLPTVKNSPNQYGIAIRDYLKKTNKSHRYSYEKERVLDYGVKINLFRKVFPATIATIKKSKQKFGNETEGILITYDEAKINKTDLERIINSLQLTI